MMMIIPTQEGIIPADAGSTAVQQIKLSTATDHPRGCGEHIRVRSTSIESMGSSPRMRGAHGP